MQPWLAPCASLPCSTVPLLQSTSRTKNPRDPSVKADDGLADNRLPFIKLKLPDRTSAQARTPLVYATFSVYNLRRRSSLYSSRPDEDHKNTTKATRDRDERGVMMHERALNALVDLFSLAVLASVLYLITLPLTVAVIRACERSGA